MYFFDFSEYSELSKKLNEKVKNPSKTHKLQNESMINLNDTISI